MVEGTTGFDQLPRRPVVATLAVFVAVVAGSAVFAHLFRETTLDALRWIADESSATDAARSLHPAVLFVLVTTTVASAAAIGLFVDARFRDHVGVEAVAASARGESRSISLRASLARALATWFLSVGAASVGRESAIIETGGAAGAVSGRRTGGRGDALATAGIAAAFAAAYHAPVAAVLYVEEHLGVRRSRRAVAFAVAGAAGGHALTRWLFEVEPIFPSIEGSAWSMLAWAPLVVVPALLAARAFRQVRIRLNGRAIADRFRVRRWMVVLGLSAVAGLAVAVFPLAAGNGMEALRSAAAAPTLEVALALAVGKLIGTAATLASGAPGGVVTPTMSIAAGAGLVTVLAARELGVPIDHPWDLMVVCLAVGITVGIRSPLVAAVLVPEMLGAYSLVPAIVVVVAAATLIDRGVDRVLSTRGAQLPAVVYDEDG